MLLGLSARCWITQEEYQYISPYGVVNSSIKQLNICGSFHHEKIQAFETVASNFDGLLRVKNGALNSERRRPGRAKRVCWNFIINAPGKAVFMA